MKIYKTRVTQNTYREITRDNFEADTLRSYPWYRKNSRGEQGHYAVCPCCDNPIVIVNLYTEKHHGRHHNESLQGLAKLNAEELENCPLYLPRKEPSKDSRRRSIEGIPLRILNILVSEFDRVAYILQKTTGINFSDSVLEKMLKGYAGEQGYLYTGANAMNVPWIFAYMANSVSLIKQFVKNEALIEAIKRHVPGVNVTPAGQIDKKASFLNLNVSFTHHKTRFSENRLQETLVMNVFQDETKIIYQQEIVFDHDYFQKILVYTAFERKQNRLDMAQKILGHLLN